MGSASPSDWNWVAIGSIATAVGALATAAAAIFVWWQISDAKSALYGSNSYTLHKDLIDAFDHVEEAKGQIDLKGSQDPALKLALKRQVMRFDALIEAAEGLYNNGTLSSGTWEQILKTMCPSFKRSNYKSGGYDLSGLKAACDNGRPIWEIKAG